MPDEITVEVAYALPERQCIISLNVERGCSAFEAARRSRIADLFEGLDIEHAKMGIFGRLLADPRSHVLGAGERVEIYRPLAATPRTARKARASR